jgi:hypothetical protein
MGTIYEVQMFLREDPVQSIDDPCRDRDEDMGTVDLVPTTFEGPVNTHGLNLSRIETRLDLVKEATRILPTNEFNLPTYVYRSDLLTLEMVQRPEMVEGMLETARVYLEYHHGFPTVKDEQPFWAQLEWEPKGAFEAFLVYLELGGARSLDKVQHLAPDLVKQYFHMYYWGHRAHAFDMYLVAHHARLRHQRIFEVEDTHWKHSKRLFERLSGALESVSNDKLAEVEPDKLVKMLKTAVDIQRLAAGLTTGGNNKADADGPKSPSVEITMRQIAEGQGAKPSQEVDVDFSQIYSDPEALAAAQSVVIKVNR